MNPTGANAAIAPNRTTNKALDTAFNRADADGDGKLSRDESEHFPTVAQRFEQIDGNRDNVLSREELNMAAGA